MHSSGLIFISISAFIAVFILLALLAVIMRLIVFIFPEKPSSDTAILAAIAGTMATLFPGSKIKNIEEIK